MKFVALIPARGGSKGISRKNVRMLHGHPLIAHTIVPALAVPHLTEVFVSTEDEEIAEIAHKYGAKILSRDPILAADKATAYQVIEDAFARLPNIDCLVYLQPTSPLRKTSDITAALESFIEGGYSSLVSVTEVPHNFSIHKQLRLDGQLLVPLLPDLHSTDNRQNIVRTYARNGPAILITKRETVNAGSIFGERVGAYEMLRQCSVDIDDPFDFAIAEYLMSQTAGSDLLDR